MKIEQKNNNGVSGNFITFAQASVRLRDLVFFVVFTVLIIGLFTFKLSLDRPYFQLLPWRQSTSNGLILLLLSICGGYYLTIRKSQQLSNRRLRDFLALISLFVILTIKGAGVISLYLVPVAFGTALVTIFLDTEVGLVLATIFSLIVGVEGGFVGNLGPVIVAFAGGIVGIFGVQDIKRGSDLTKAGLSVGIVNAILAFGFRFPTIHRPILSNLNWENYGWAGFNGLISALFIAGAVPLAERLTQKTSPIGLMELLNPSHPLLERMRSEAPGSYHHSRNIASLGENAARAIEADPLLTAVGGYYHDIGKMIRPDFFIENQDPSSNPHDKLTPTMSKIVLTSHIKQGIEIGKRYGLKQDVLNFIPTHHGTSVIKYFYLKALREKREDAELAEEEFRYEAPLPRTKETSIIALADPVEAASHSISDTRTKEVEEMVEEEILSKIDEGQLDKSPLTLADIEIIKQEFVNTIRAMSHNRLSDYPEFRG